MLLSCMYQHWVFRSGNFWYSRGTIRTSRTTRPTSGSSSCQHLSVSWQLLYLWRLFNQYVCFYFLPSTATDVDKSSIRSEFPHYSTVTAASFKWQAIPTLQINIFTPIAAHQAYKPSDLELCLPRSFFSLCHRHRQKDNFFQLSTCFPYFEAV